MRLRSFLLWIAVWVAIWPSCGRTQSPSKQAPPEPGCIGLVLGGGGARGAAHIGVLQVLEREHIPICRVSGTSMGAIVGGLYASGYTPDEMARIVTTLDWKDLFSDDPARVDMPMHRKDADYRYLLNFEVGYRNGRIITPAGFVQGQKLLLLLRRLLISTWDVHDFDQLAIPFRAVATDIVAGKPVVFGSGELPLAIRSSMSVPGAFAPVNVDGQLLVDGGVMDNIPIDVIRQMGAHRLIVVDVGSPLSTQDQLTNPVALLSQMVSALMAEKTQRQLATLTPDDILIRPALGDITAAQFNRGAEAIAIGKAAAEAAIPRLRALSASPADWEAFQARHRLRDFDPALVAFLKVDGTNTQTAPFIKNSMASEVGKPYDPDRLESQIGTVYGRGNYQQIDYRLQQQDEQRGLLIIPADKPWGPVYGRVGLQLDNNFNGNSQYLILGEINATNVNRYGADWRSTLWGGRIGGVGTEFYQPMGQNATTYVQPSALLRNEDLPIFDSSGDRQLADYRVRRAKLGLEVGWSPASYWRLLSAFTRGRDTASLTIGNPTSFPDQTFNYSMFKVGLDWDSLDSAQFPTKGAHVQLGYEMYRTVLGGQVTGDVARLTADWVPRFWAPDSRYHLLLGMRLSSAIDNSNFFETQDFLGGFLNLSGYSERALYGNQSALLRAVIYRRTGQLDAIFSTPFYIGGSLEAGNTWHNKNDVRLDSLIYAGSIFAGLQSPLGPVFLGYGYADGGHSAIYLTFGSLLRPRP